MSILHKYWLKEFIKYFFIIHLIVQFIFVMVDYLSRMDHFLESSITLVRALGYVLLKVPFMFVELTPAVVMLSVIVVFGLMNRNNELVAVKSSGVSIYHLVKPAAFVGIILSFAMIFLGETIVPVTMARANYIKYVVIKGERSVHRSRKDIWMKNGKKIIHIKYYNLSDDTISGLTLTRLDDTFDMVKRIDAQSGKFQNGTWYLSGVLEQDYVKERDEYEVSSHANMVYDIGIEPQNLRKIVKKSEEMDLAELSDYINKVEAEGYDASRYRVDFHAKIAFPFICFLMALTGTATGMRPVARSHLPLAVALGVLISFVYWVMYSFCVSLGYGKMLHPFVSAWLTNLVFLFFSAWFLLTVDA